MKIIATYTKRLGERDIRSLKLYYYYIKRIEKKIENIKNRMNANSHIVEILDIDETANIKEPFARVKFNGKIFFAFKDELYDFKKKEGKHYFKSIETIYKEREIEKLKIDNILIDKRVAYAQKAKCGKCETIVKAKQNEQINEQK